MPRRRIPLSAAARPARIRITRRPDEIIAQRERLVAEVDRIEAALGQSSRFGAQARELLTRAWGKADWKRRQDLVRTVQWLVQLETRAVASDP